MLEKWSSSKRLAMDQKTTSHDADQTTYSYGFGVCGGKTWSRSSCSARRPGVLRTLISDTIESLSTLVIWVRNGKRWVTRLATPNIERSWNMEYSACREHKVACLSVLMPIQANGSKQPGTYQRPNCASRVRHLRLSGLGKSILRTWWVCRRGALPSR